MSQDESRSLPTVVDRSTFQEQLEALRVREKAHTGEGDAIAAARCGSRWSRLPQTACCSGHAAQ